jgi:acetyltransferase
MAGEMEQKIKLIDSLLNPKSIAIIGATENSVMVRKMLGNLESWNYKGRIYPINPKYQNIFGRKAYPNVNEVPEEIDNAVIIIPAKFTLKAVEECIQKKVKSVVIISSGFAERGAKEGSKIQQELTEMISKNNNIVVCGPNCFGTIDVIHRATSFCEIIPKELESGDIGAVFQSGAMIIALYTLASERGIAFNYLISAGNQADLEVADYFSYMLEDENTKVMVGFVEGVKNLDKFVKVAEAALRKRKPIIMLKIGSSEYGVTGALNHTGSLAGEDEVFEKIFAENAIVRVDEIEDLIETASFFSKVLRNGKKIKGKNLGVITMSGGVGSMIGDLAAQYGFKLPISKHISDELQNIIPEFGTAGNPLDVTVIPFEYPENFKQLVKVFMKEKDIGMIGYALSMGFPKGPSPGDKLISIFSELQKDTDNAFFLFSIGAMSLNDYGKKRLKEVGLPLVSGIGRCMKVLNAFVQYSKIAGLS